jgi:hypothetical protein
MVSGRISGRKEGNLALLARGASVVAKKGSALNSHRTKGGPFDFHSQELNGACCRAAAGETLRNAAFPAVFSLLNAREIAVTQPLHDYDHRPIVITLATDHPINSRSDRLDLS